jgi:phenylacetate-coenzyme A ligase PaaK-like adenylate-forming protein
LGRFQIIVDRPTRQDELTIKIALRHPTTDRETLRQYLMAEIRQAIRLTAAIQLVEPGQLPETAPLVEDRRRVE